MAKIGKIHAREDGQLVEVVPELAQSAVNDGAGRNIETTYAVKEELTDGSVTKVMHGETIGSESRPIFIKEGVPTVATGVIDTSSTAQTKAGSLTVGKSLGVTDTDGPGVDLTATTNAFGHVDYTNIDGGSSGFEFTPNGVRRKGTVTDGAHPDTLVTKADVFTGSGSGANNLLHTIGNEDAEGFKRMNAVVKAGGMAAETAEYYTVIATLGTLTTSARFPFAFGCRYGVFNGVGDCNIDGVVTLKGVARGGFNNVRIGTIRSDGVTYLVCKRGTTAGQSVGAWLPFRSISTGIYAGYIAGVPDTLVPTEDDPFIPAVWELIE